MGKYFGTDGFRGEANVHLTVEHAYKIGRYLGWYYKKKGSGKILIGKDTRRSGYMLEYAMASGIVASGSDAYLLHVTSTPSVSFVVRTDDFDCGVMISASHNPYYDNGIKLIDSNGFKISREIEIKIEEYMDGVGETIDFAHRDCIGKTIDYAIGRNRYIGYLISIASHSFKGYKIGLDCSNGSASSIAKSVFDALGAKTYVINNEPDGTNINENCGSTNTEALRELVKEKGLDIGFAYDGDADRCIAIDENGKEVNGDIILYICGSYLKKQGRLDKDTVVTTVMSNIGFYKAFDEIGINYTKTDVGDKYVSAELLEHKFSLGGEQSGHIIFSRLGNTGDGIITSLMIMEALISSGEKISSLYSKLKIYPQILVNVKVSNKEEAITNEKVLEKIRKYEKELQGDGRILVRKSGTEPLIRVMVEAKTNALCSKYANGVVVAMEEEGLVLEIK